MCRSEWDENGKLGICPRLSELFYAYSHDKAFAEIFCTTDTPGKPGQPRVTDWDADRIDIEWDPPENDGGAKIEGYVVEQYDPTSKDWVKVKEVKDPKASIGGLKEGKEYQFRVRAVNKAGPGEPSKPSEKQIAKPRFGIVFCA